MQELAYSTYCSLKHLSRQGYLSQESHFIIAWQTCGAWQTCPMIMCYNFFVGQVYHGLCVHDVVNLYKTLYKLFILCYNI